MNIEGAILIALVVAVSFTGSRLALRREPNWGAGQLDPVIHYAFTVMLMIGVMLTTGALIWPFWYPAGTPYLTIAVISGAAVLFGMSVVPSRWWIAVAVAWAAVGGAWIIASSWEIYTIAAVATVIALFTLIRPQFSFWEASALLVLVSGWDAWNLFVTQSAAVAAAAQVDPFAPGGNVHAAGLPEFIGIAARLAPLSTYVTGIGIGDLTLPGLLIVAAGRAGKLAKAPQLYWAATGAYAASLVVVMITSNVTNLAMPVLPFATTAIVAAVALTTWRTGAWRSLASRHLPAAAAAPVRARKAVQS